MKFDDEVNMQNDTTPLSQSPPASTPEYYPLTLVQQEIWLDQMLHPDLPLYNIGGYMPQYPSSGTRCAYTGGETQAVCDGGGKTEQ